MKEKVILVGVNYKNQEDFTYSLEELKNLASGMGYEIVDIVTQNLNQINKNYYIGSGKLEELIIGVENENIDKVIFNNELSLSQVKNLENKLTCDIVDRSHLIIDIFSKRAKSKEAKLQIEIARLQYLLPRLTESNETATHQRGGGVINRGSGEKKIDIDRKAILRKITHLKSELDDVVLKRKTKRQLRQKNEEKIVSLVGYTNTGKSTLLNVLLEQFQSKIKSVYEKDELFATLDTSVRQIELEKNKSFLLTDTVGFIDDLPHHLVESFRSTLEEINESDLLLHIVDYSNPNYSRQIKTALQTLEEIGIINIPIITVYNKIDLVNHFDEENTEDTIYISAKNKLGLDALVNNIKEHIFNDYLTTELFIPYKDEKLVHFLHENSIIKDTNYDSQGTKLTVECSQKIVNQIKDYIL